MNTSIADQITARLVGQKLLRVEKSDNDWLFEFDNEISVRVFCGWRIVCNGRIAYGLSDDAQQFGLPAPVDGERRSNQLLQGQTIEAITLREDTGDFTVAFRDRTLLEVLNDSSGYEGWHLYERSSGEGLDVVAMGGGQLVRATAQEAKGNSPPGSQC